MVAHIRKTGSGSNSWARWAASYELTGPGEFQIIGLLMVVLALFKIINAATYPFDTDESQHLHVIWGWARGFVEYRDLNDNHMPFFHMLFAPIFQLLGDRATILFWMRFILLPLNGVVIWCTYRLGTLLFNRRVGLWAAILAGFYPGYHFCSLEFRTDNLWAPLWVLSILVLVESGLTRRSACKSGVLIGLAFAVSMKTSLLLASIATAGLFSLLLLRSRKMAASPGELAGRAALFLLTALLVPSIVILGFVYAGTWPDMRYWAFENNLLPGFRNHPVWWSAILPLTFPLALAAAWQIARRTPDTFLAWRRLFVFLIWAFYVPALWGFWPIITRQDYLPYQPIGFPFYAAALLFLSDRLALHWLKPAWRILPGPLPVAVGFFLVALLAHPFWTNGAKAETDLLRSTLALTNPSDFVLDMKGETVFRQRCFKPIWEPLVMERIRRGLIQDVAPERCIETRTCVATKGRDMSKRATRFVEQYFLPVGTQLYVAGCWLPTSPGSPPLCAFETIIPADYTIVSTDGSSVRGILDGKVYAGESRSLAPGHHEFAGDLQGRRLSVVWTQAVSRGFPPLWP